MLIKNPVLSLKVGWLVVTILVFLDAFLDSKRGVEGNPLWQPIVEKIGIQNIYILVPFVLLLFWLVVKFGGWLTARIDKTPQAEELVLTALVLVYGLFDLWVIAVDFLNFHLITNYRLLVIPLTIIAVFYAVWAEKKLKQ